jgi:hypothetical protein
MMFACNFMSKAWTYEKNFQNSSCILLRASFRHEKNMAIKKIQSFYSLDKVNPKVISVSEDHSFIYYGDIWLHKGLLVGFKFLEESCTYSHKDKRPSWFCKADFVMKHRKKRKNTQQMVQRMQKFLTNQSKNVNPSN